MHFSYVKCYNSRHRFSFFIIRYKDEGDRRGICVTNNAHHRSLLTKREREIFNLLMVEHSTRDIAEKLGISEKTVRNHISNAIQKLGVSNRSQAIIELLRLQELSLE